MDLVAGPEHHALMALLLIAVILMRQHRLGFGHGMVQLIKHLRRMNIILIMNIIFTLQVQVQMNSLVLKI